MRLWLHEDWLSTVQCYRHVSVFGPRRDNVDTTNHGTTIINGRLIAKGQGQAHCILLTERTCNIHPPPAWIDYTIATEKWFRNDSWLLLNWLKRDVVIAIVIFLIIIMIIMITISSSSLYIIICILSEVKTNVIPQAGIDSEVWDKPSWLWIRSPKAALYSQWLVILLLYVCVYAVVDKFAKNKNVLQTLRTE